MVQTILGPDHDLAKRLSKLEKDVAALNTRDVLQNATFGPNGTTVAQAFDQLQNAINSVVLPEFNQIGVQGFAITTAITAQASLSFTVPAGYTYASVLATAEGIGVNASGVSDYLYVSAVVNGVNGGELMNYAPNGVSVGLSSLLYWGFTVTGGQTFTVSGAIRTAFHTWAASAINTSNIYALVIYSR